MAPHAPRFSVEPSCTRPFTDSAPGSDTRRLCPRVARGRVYSEPGGGKSRPLAPPGPAAEHDRRPTVTAKHLRRQVRNLRKGSDRAGRARSSQRDVGLGHRNGDDGPARVGERVRREAGPRGATPAECDARRTCTRPAGNLPASSAERASIPEKLPGGRRPHSADHGCAVTTTGGSAWGSDCT